MNKKLLELAAKAAGVALYWAEDDPECDWVQGSYPRIINNQVLEKWTWKIWNPLTDDGDALRLAVRLSINIVPNYHAEWHIGNGDTFKAGREFTTECEVQADPYAATRRAIVRAAAEIGKTIANNLA